MVAVLKRPKQGRRFVPGRSFTENNDLVNWELPPCRR
jgi:hypothetical protein